MIREMFESLPEHYLPFYVGGFKISDDLDIKADLSHGCKNRGTVTEAMLVHLKILIIQEVSKAQIEELVYGDIYFHGKTFTWEAYGIDENEDPGDYYTGAFSLADICGSIMPQEDVVQW
jgi:hypothetical protein